MIAALERLTSGFEVSFTVIYASLIASLIVLIVTLIQLSRFRFWSNQGVKGPKPWPFLGNTTDLLFGSMIETLDSRWRKYGPVHGTYRGSKPQLVLGDPDMLKDALVRDWHVFADRRGGSKDGNRITDNFLVTLSGNDWKRMRTVMSPTFTSGKMKSMFNIMNDCCNLMVKNIQKRIKDKELEVNFRHLAGCYSMDVIAKCCFATDTNSFDDPDQVFVTFARKFFQVSKLKRFMSVMLPNSIKALTGFTTQTKESILFLEHVASTLLAERMKSTDGHQNSALDNSKQDYLQLLIEASKGQGSKVVDEKVPDNESHHGYEEMNGKINETLIKETMNELKKPLSTDEIVSNSVLFLAVGYDTTGSLITTTSYLLTVNPDKQQKLYEEVKSAHEQNGGKFNYETVSGLKYLDAVISESLRIYPPAPLIERRALEEYTFKKNGIFIPKGGIVWLPIWNIHHEPKYWNDPWKFEPERFLPENRDKIIPYSYIPFGGGPRNCIGMRFALLEAKLAIANLIFNFKFTPTANTDVPLDLSPTTALLSPKRVLLGVRTRSNNNS